jgi:hypothetical protein
MSSDTHPDPVPFCGACGATPGACGHTRPEGPAVTKARAEGWLTGHGYPDDPYIVTDRDGTARTPARPPSSSAPA